MLIIMLNYQETVSVQSSFSSIKSTSLYLLYSSWDTLYSTHHMVGLTIYFHGLTRLKKPLKSALPRPRQTEMFLQFYISKLLLKNIQTSELSNCKLFHKMYMACYEIKENPTKN